MSTVPVADAEALWSAALRFGANAFVHVVNATLLVFIFSAANSQLYIASRTLYGLALLGQAPKIFRKVNRRGVPMPALAFCSCFSLLVFLNAAEGPGKGT
jgi:amino acid transporter